MAYLRKGMEFRERGFCREEEGSSASEELGFFRDLCRNRGETDYSTLFFFLLGDCFIYLQICAQSDSWPHIPPLPRVAPFVAPRGSRLHLGNIPSYRDLHFPGEASGIFGSQAFPKWQTCIFMEIFGSDLCS
jgi:hypothetical protein